MKKSYIFISILILLSFILAWYFYPSVPEKVASHWNAKGEVDGYMSKFLGLFLMPIISIPIFLLFIFIPKIDPLKKNIKSFRNYFDGFIVLIFLFLFYLQGLTLTWNLGYVFSMNIMLMPALGILFIFVGFLLEKCKRNWFIGIRTPWTMSSDKVWNKTHKLGSLIFKVCGILVIVGLFFPDYLMWIILIPILAGTLFLVVYSYLEFRKEKK